MIKKASIISVLITIIFISVACQSREGSIFLIPEGYQGSITIFLDRPDGEPMRYEEGDRVFNVPSNGVLFSQFGTTSRFADYKLFYVSKDGKRREIPDIGLAEIDSTIPIDSGTVYTYRSGYTNTVLSDGQTLKNVPGYKPGDTVKNIKIVLSSPKDWDSIAELSLRQHSSFFEISTYR